jgi:hypothetical protein
MYAYSVQPTANFSCNSWRARGERKRGNGNQSVSFVKTCDAVQDGDAQAFGTHLSLDAGCIFRSLGPQRWLRPHAQEQGKWEEREKAG